MPWNPPLPSSLGTEFYERVDLVQEAAATFALSIESSTRFMGGPVQILSPCSCYNISSNPPTMIPPYHGNPSYSSRKMRVERKPKKDWIRADSIILSARPMSFVIALAENAQSACLCGNSSSRLPVCPPAF